MNTGFGKFTLACAAIAITMASSGAMAAGPVASIDAPVSASAGVILVADQAEGAKNFIASMGDRGINFLGNESMSVEAKKAEFSQLLNDSFDMSTIGRFSLGTYWKTATPAQQQEYQKLFNTMIVKVYSKRFSDYKGQKFDVRSARPEGKDSVVTSFIVPSDGPQVQVDWRVRNKGGSYKVVDVIIEGVSMSLTQRSDFSSVIQQGGGDVQSLLVHLRGQQ